MTYSTLLSKVRRTIGVFITCAVCASSVACGSSSPTTPTAPTAPPQASGPSLPATLAGVWRGYLKVATCYPRLPSPCQPDVTLPFVLRVATDGPGYLGTFQYDDGSVSPFILDVGGVNTPDGSALFAGWRDFGNGSRSDLRRLQVKLDGAAGLTGDIDLVHLVTGTERTMTGRVLSASYQPISQPNISGSWSGQAIMRACSGYCPSFQTTGQRVNLTVVLGQSGTAVTGQTQLSLFSCPGCWLPLTGTIADGRLSLSSAAVSRPAPFNDRMQHMESFDASFDALGRIVGRFVYAADSRIAISPFDVSYRVECEILWLSRN